VFLLKEIVEHDHAEIADILGISVDNSRQLLHRAKDRIAAGAPRLTGTPESRRAVAERFASAFSSGDAGQLTTLLTNDVAMWADGGGKASAVRRPVLGRDAVVNFLTAIYRANQTAGLIPKVSLQIESVNFEPAVVIRVSGQLVSLFVFETDGHVITGIRAVRNPDKLARLDRLLYRAPAS